MRIGIDLDGVCYDFVDALRGVASRHELGGTWSAPATCWDFFSVDWGWTTREFYAAMAEGVMDRKLFWNGDPTPGCRRALRYLRDAGHEVVIVTHRAHPDPFVEAEIRRATVAWLAAEKIPHDSLIFDGTKTRLGLDLMLDDAPHQIAAAREAGERAVYFHRAWNEHEEGERVFNWPEFETLVARSQVTVIGVSGKAQHGKDTIGTILVDECGFERASFADALRTILVDLDPLLMPAEGNYDSHGDMNPRRGYRYVVPLAEYVRQYGWEEAKRRTDARDHQIRLGMALRSIDSDFWVDAAVRSLRPGGKYVFTDVRFANEAKAIRDLGGEVWRVERPGVPSSDHESETQLDDYSFDFVLNNTLGVAELRDLVLALPDVDR